MTSIHVVTRGNRDLYRDALQQCFRLRHDIFVGERGWMDLARPDGLDIDAYDDEHAVYLLALDGGRIVGGQRLYPTLQPHMISEVFPHLVAREILRDPTVFEWTRYFVVKERRMGRTDCRLLAALQDFCLEEGITHVTAVVEMWWLPRWQQAGFKVRPLGLPSPVEGQPTIAALIEISQESSRAVRRIGGLPATPLIRHGETAPLAEMAHAAA
jgi:acyl-homoserine lactone synthase